MKNLECSSCGATANAACSCGVEYVPAGTRAIKAVAESPGKSDRAIAKELGVSPTIVHRARRKATAHKDAVPRVGLDGKARKQPSKTVPTHQEQTESPKAWRIRIANAIAIVDEILEATETTDMIAGYADIGTCPKTPQMLKAIDLVITRWTKLRATLKKEIQRGKA